MTDKEIELAMEGIFRGASKVRRARKYAKNLSNNVNRELTFRIAAQVWKERNKHLMTA